MTNLVGHRQGRGEGTFEKDFRRRRTDGGVWVGGEASKGAWVGEGGGAKQERREGGRGKDDEGGKLLLHDSFCDQLLA